MSKGLRFFDEGQPISGVRDTYDCLVWFAAEILYDGQKNAQTDPFVKTFRIDQFGVSLDGCHAFNPANTRRIEGAHNHPD